MIVNTINVVCFFSRIGLLPASGLRVNFIIKLCSVLFLNCILTGVKLGHII